MVLMSRQGLEHIDAVLGIYDQEKDLIPSGIFLSDGRGIILLQAQAFENARLLLERLKYLSMSIMEVSAHKRRIFSLIIEIPFEDPLT